MNVESEVLKKIIPTEADVSRINGTAVRLKALVQKYLDDNHIDAELKFVGSYSKGTYLSNPDLDLFIMFPVGTPREELVKTGLKIGEDVLHGSRMYAEHPYTSAIFEGVDVDLVPNIHIKDTSEMVTAVDRTPFHTDFVLKALKEGQNNQIRLLKKFMKGIGTYGAEPNVRGFSGYLCEILVLKYGSFREVLEAAVKQWHNNIQLDLGNKGPRLESAMVFYDPVDGKRNVASAVHLDTMGRFIIAAKEYLAHPDEKYFFPAEQSPHSDEWIREHANCGAFRLISVSFDKPDVVDDNIYSQLWKTRYALESKLTHSGFTVLYAAHRATEDRMLLAFMLETDELSKAIKHPGPPVNVANADKYLERWNREAIVKPFIEDGRWCAIIPRQYTSAAEMLVNEIAQTGVGKELDLSSLEVMSHEETIEQADRQLLSDLLDTTPVWRR